MSTLLPQQTGVGGKEVVCVHVHYVEHSSRGLLSFRREIKIKAAPTLFLLQPLSDYVFFCPSEYNGMQNI